MTPRRVKLEGFLCYKEARTIDLQNADLWVFTGRNGSGKSAVFDAVTFALFGWHRGSSDEESKLEDLINQESDGLRVEFEFELDGRIFRIQRSLRRGQGSERQVCEYTPSNDGAAAWPPVPETHRKTGFDDWIKRQIGMSPRAFTASVLLRQGEADRLVSARPKERVEIISEVVDLDRYKQLAKAAGVRSKAAQELAAALSSQLQVRKETSAETVDEARRLAGETEEARLAADRERERFLTIERQAREWSALTRRRDDERVRLARAEALLAEGEAVERDAARLGELKSVLPVLTEQAGRAEAIMAVEEAIFRLGTERTVAAEKRDRIDDLIAQATEHRRAVAEEAECVAARRTEIEAERARLALPMDRATRAAQADREVASLKARIAARPAGLSDEVEAAEARSRRAAEARAALPWLASFADERAALARARDDGRVAEADIARLGRECQELTAERTRRLGSLEQARVAEADAHARVVREGTRRDDLRRRLAALDGLDGKPECDLCGQPLTASHLDVERARMEERIGAVEASMYEAREGLNRTEADRRAAEASVSDADDAIQAAGSLLSQASLRLAQAVGAVENHRANCRRAHDSLAEAERSNISLEEPDDWTNTTFPSQDDLEAYRREAARLEDLDEALASASEALTEDRSDRDALEAALCRSRAIGLKPGDERAAEEDGRLAKELEAIQAGAGDRARRLTQTEDELGGLHARRECLDRSLARTDRDLVGAEAQAEVRRQARGQARSDLPEFWWAEFDSVNAARVASLRKEKSALERDGIETKFASIPAARDNRDSASAAIREVESLLETIPDEARRDPDGVVAEVAAAKDRLDELTRAATTSRVEADRLATAREEFRSLSARSREAARRAAIAERLAKLLGWDGLQRQLLARAERDIVAHANPILDRISGGDLQLRLCAPGDANRALDLEVVDRTHGRRRVIKAWLLSGGQKFRVAASLALAVGRTMKQGRDRPIDSVVIDEGFGSLDAQGRREMAAQMRDLRGFLSRIVLVSHQEDFAGAFDDGYQFEIVDGATVVRRIGA